MSSKQEQVLEAILDIGEIMLVAGAEINRVEDTMTRISAAYGFTKADVYAIPTAIVVTVRDPEEDILTQSRRITGASADLTLVEKCNALSRRVCKSPMKLEDLQASIQEIRETKEFPGWLMFFGYGLMCSGFSIYFGGKIQDAVCAGLCGLLLWVLQKFFHRLRMQDMVTLLLSSLVIGLVAGGMTKIGIGPSTDKIILGTIMPMIPGLALVSALRDMINGDSTSGVTGLLAALVRAMMIAVGFGMAMLWWSRQGLDVRTVLVSRTVKQQIQGTLIPCMLACAAYGITFHVTGWKKYGAIMLGSGLGYVVSILVQQQTGSAGMAALVGTLVILVSGEVFVRILKTPLTVLMVPMLMALIPGGDLYRATVNIVLGDTEMMSHFIQLVSVEAAGMAFAIILEASCMQMGFRIWKTVFEKKGRAEWKK